MLVKKFSKIHANFAQLNKMPTLGCIYQFAVLSLNFAQAYFFFQNNNLKYDHHKGF